MKCTVWGIQPGIMYYLYMVTDCGWTYCGDHFDMYSGYQIPMSYYSN